MICAHRQFAYIGTFLQTPRGADIGKFYCILNYDIKKLIMMQNQNRGTKAHENWICEQGDGVLCL